jgi:predicted phage baseplate assembly protein
MSLPKPNLDDKRFDQLVEEARKLIPRYDPQWTDHNWSDPGITFIDLFAWLTEMTLYRINLVNDSHRLKYLKLLGVRPLPSMPSKVELTFKSDHMQLLKSGEETYTEISDNKIYFELCEDITIVPLILKKVIVYEVNVGVFDRTDANEKDDLFYAPFGFDVRAGCMLYLGFDLDESADPGNLDSVSFECYLYETGLKEPVKHDEEENYDFVNAKLRWEYSSSGTINWKNTSPIDETKGFKRSGKLIFKDMKDWNPSVEVKDTHYWLRCVVEESGFEYPPRVETIRLNTVSAVHGRTIRIKENWHSNGLPGQVFKLKNKPVLDGTLELLVSDIHDNIWTQVDDFDGSGPDDNHFILDKEKGEVRFGDGLMGRVPPWESKVEFIKYRVGGGEEGNIKAGYEWTIENKDLDIKNYNGSAGGTRAETIQETVERCLKDLKVPYKAVTAGDFEYIAKNTPGLRVAKAKAIPNYRLEEGNIKGTVAVVVIPDTPLESFVTPPIPSGGFMNSICLHLDKHRLLGTSVQVVPPEYVKVNVSVTVVPTNGFSEEKLKNAVKNKLNLFLHPIKGGADNNGWQIGRTVSRSEIYEVLEKIDGLECVTKLILSGDNDSSPDNENLKLPKSISTVYPGSINVTISKDVDGCRKKRNGNGKN